MASCQSSYKCPDKIGHCFLHFVVVYFLIWILEIALKLTPHWLVYFFFGLLWGISIEVYEGWKYGDQSLKFWKRFLKWLGLQDTKKDIVVDLVGVIGAILFYESFGFHWWVLILAAIISAFFGRFVAWDQMKRNWADWKFWKYLP